MPSASVRWTLAGIKREPGFLLTLCVGITYLPGQASILLAGEYNKKTPSRWLGVFMAPPVGLEPTTCGLTVRRSTD